MNHPYIFAVSTVLALAGTLALASEPYQDTKQTLAAREMPRALVGPLSGATVPAVTPPDAALAARVTTAYGQLPLSFEANRGQSDKKVKFLSRGQGYSLFLTPTEAVLSLSKSRETTTPHAGPVNHPTKPPLTADPAQKTATAVVRMGLVGAHPPSAPVGVDPLPGKSNYLLGNDPKQWHTDVPHYAKVQYHNVYPGIDLLYYGHQRQLEYDFVVAPGTDPKAIRLSFQGADRLSLDAQGNLLLHTALGEIIQHKPILYQEIQGQRKPVQGQYVLLPSPPPKEAKAPPLPPGIGIYTSRCFLQGPV